MRLLQRLTPYTGWLGCALMVGSFVGLVGLTASVVLPRGWLAPPWAAGSVLTRTRDLAAKVASPPEIETAAAPAGAPTPGHRLGPNALRLYDMWIPKLGLYVPIIAVAPRATTIDGQAVTQLDAPNAFAVGWSAQSAPIGAAGNTVLIGHNNEFGDVFKDLWYLEVGDEIVVYLASGEQRYVTSDAIYFEEQNLSLAERLANAAWIAPTSDERLTLVTCWPYYTNTHRLVIVARPLN